MNKSGCSVSNPGVFCATIRDYQLAILQDVAQLFVFRQLTRMAKEFEVVDVWVGQFANRQALTQYLQEVYDEGNEKPISRLAVDMGQRFYDHDFLEHSFYDESSSDFLSRLAPHSHSKSFARQAGDAFTSASVGKFNTILLAWGETIRHPVSVGAVDYSLHYLGRFECRPVA